jgi:2-keto-4-pentenoate hydratase/2-oxohepta-3-ene-1,7-dioic acid hydratase in catechol pathway
VRLATVLGAGRTEVYVVDADGRRGLPVSALGDGLPTTMIELIRAGEPVRSHIEAAVGKRPGWDEMLGMTLAAPIPAPPKILAIGRNYRGHASEEGVPLPTEPLIFAKLASAVVGPGAAIVWDEDRTTSVDYEAELAVVIGRRARNVEDRDALDFVFGYTCANDVSARDLQTRDGQWTRAKGLDTFCPLGPWIVTADEIENPQDLELECRVDGDLRQSSNTSAMVFGVAALISYLSRQFTLEPGDVILTGTPDGVGAFRSPPLFLQHGQEIVVAIEGIGELRNECEIERRSRALPAS